MWRGFFAIGGQEVGNSARAISYQQTADCAIGWIEDREDYSTVSDALEHSEYDWQNISEAPWFDPDDVEKSSRILGLYVVDMQGLEDSTRSAEVAEKIVGGGRVGRQRDATREVRLRVALTAAGRDALEAGKTWLDTAMSARSCGVHEGSCGLTDFQFFVEAPPARGVVDVGGEQEAESDIDYRERVRRYERYLHDVKCVSGPRVVEELISSNGIHYGYVFEIILVSEVPYVFTAPRQVEIPAITPSVIQDVPFNIMRYPSAENAVGTIVVSQNYCTNPSLETDAAGWSGTAATVSGTSPTSYFTSGRVTGELAAAGTASYRCRLLGNGSTTASGTATMSITHDSVFGAQSSNVRDSVTIWAAGVSVGGATGASLLEIQIIGQYRSSTANVGSAFTIGSSTDPTDISGRAWAVSSHPIPTGADRLRVTVTLRFTWSSSATPAQNSDIRLYADALAVTIP